MQMERDGNLDNVGGLVGENSGTITACYATGNANGEDGQFSTLSAGSWGRIVVVARSRLAMPLAMQMAGLVATTLSAGSWGGIITGTITACYGFGMVTGREMPGVDRSGDASDSTVGSASALTMANSSTDLAKRWPARVWDFGTDSQAPVLKWITGYNRRGDTDEAKYPCDPALLPDGRECGDIIPGQGR